MSHLSNRNVGVKQTGVDAFLESINNITEASFTSPGDKRQALLAVYSLMSRLESPWDTSLRMYLSQVMPYLLVDQKQGNILILYSPRSTLR